MPAYTYIGDGNPDGIQVAASSTEKIGFWGATPVSRRTGYATSLVATASSADVTTDLKAAVIELQNTMSAYGFWAAQA